MHREWGEFATTITEAVEAAVEQISRLNESHKSHYADLVEMAKLLQHQAELVVALKKKVEGLEYRVRELEGRAA